MIHKKGNVTANIRKLTTTNNTTYSPLLPTVEVSGGDGTQNLNLYFDEIQNINGGDGVKVTQGIVKLIGRRIYSESGLSMDLASNAFIQCDEIINGTKGINIHNGTSTLATIDANYIEGKSHNATSGA